MQDQLQRSPEPAQAGIEFLCLGDIARKPIKDETATAPGTA